MFLTSTSDEADSALPELASILNGPTVFIVPVGIPASIFNLAPGLVVPIPIFPFSRIVNLGEVVESPVENLMPDPTFDNSVKLSPLIPSNGVLRFESL